MGTAWEMSVWDWTSSSSSSSSDDDWEQEHKQPPRYKRGGKWVRTSGDDIPTRAVVAGESSAGGPLYVGRAQHEGGLFPGKVNPEHNCCHIATGAVQGGFNEDNDPLYIGRARHEDSFAV